MADTLNDYMYAYYSRLVTGNASLSGAINVSRAAVGVEATTSEAASGQQAAPGAGTAIASLALGSGTWEIEVRTHISGTTVAATDARNMDFRIGGVSKSAIITPVPGTAGSTSPGTYNIRVNTAGATMSVNAVAAATAGSVYMAQIVASKIGF